MMTKKTLHSQLRLIKDMRNMATLNRRHATDKRIISAAVSWEALFDKKIRRLTLRLNIS